MTTVSQVMTELKKKGNEQTRKTFMRHGGPEDMFGVKIGDLKVIAKTIKGDQELACELYETGNADAMYLAGIVADGAQMTKRQLQAWVRGANWHMIAEYTVPGVACESPHAHDLAVKWIDSKQELVACAGWNTYTGLMATRTDDALDLNEIKDLLQRVVREIDDVTDRVRYTMNGFVIGVGAHVTPLLKQAKATAKKLGKVSVDMGDTSCKVPVALESIAKIEDSGRVGKKRKTIKC